MVGWRKWARPVAAIASIALLAAAASASLSAGRGTTYVVRAGDTTSSIAARFHVSVEALRSVNHLADPNSIFTGETLLIPLTSTSGIRHRASGPLAPIAAPAAGSPVFPDRLLSHPNRLALLPSFRRWAAVAGVPAGLLEAMAWMESGWQTKIVSSTGAIGVGQLEPPTVKFISHDLLGLPHPLDARNPDANIRMSAAYLSWLLGQTGRNYANAVGGYYQGLASLLHGGPWDQTRQYVLVVGQLWQQFRSG